MIDSPRYLVNGARGDRLVFPSSSQQKDSGSMKEDGCSGLCRLLIVFPVIGLWTKPLFVTFCLMPPRWQSLLPYSSFRLSSLVEDVVLIVKRFSSLSSQFSSFYSKILTLSFLFFFLLLLDKWIKLNRAAYFNTFFFNFFGIFVSVIIHEEKNKEKKFIEESHWKIRVVIAFVLRWIFWDYVRDFSLSLSLFHFHPWGGHRWQMEKLFRADHIWGGGGRRTIITLRK